MLSPLANQAIVFNERVNECSDCDPRCICQKYSQDDILNWQGKQIPCSEDLLCPFEWSYGDELIVNGEFTGSLAGWTVGSDWTYGSNKVSVNNAGVATLTQAITFGSIDYYRLRFTVKDYVSGSVGAIFGGTATDYVTANGDYEFILTNAVAGSDLDFKTGALGGNLSIDNVSAQIISSPCWVPALDSNWRISGDKMCHVVGSVTPLSGLSIPITLAQYYKVVITVSGSTAGTLTVNIRSNSFVISGNGTFTEYIDAGLAGTSFGITPDSAFDGCVSDIHLYRLNNDFEAWLVDSETGDFVTEVSNHIEYYKEWLTIVKPWSEIELPNGDPLPYGCYKLALADPCLNTNNQFLQFDTTVAASGGATSAGSFTQESLNPSCQYKLKYCYFDLMDGNSSSIDNGIEVISPVPVEYTCNRALLTPDNAGNITSNISVTSDASSSGTGYWQSLRLAAMCMTADYISNCLCYKETNPCAYLVEGYGDSPAYGFEFAVTGFKLSQRLVFVLTPNDYPEVVDEYIYSDGKREQNFAQVEDFLTLFFEQTGKTMHDCISKARRCKHFFLEDSTGVMTEYYAKPGAYQPEWVKNNASKLCPSRFDVRKKYGNIHASNCGD